MRNTKIKSQDVSQNRFSTHNKNQNFINNSLISSVVGLTMKTVWPIEQAHTVENFNLVPPPPLHKKVDIPRIFPPRFIIFYIIYNFIKCISIWHELSRYKTLYTCIAGTRSLINIHHKNLVEEKGITNKKKLNKYIKTSP